MRATADVHGELTLTGLTPAHHAMLISAVNKLNILSYVNNDDLLRDYQQLKDGLRNPEPSPKDQLILR